MMKISVARHDRGEVRGDAVITPEGYIRANAVVTRTGIFNYKNADGSLRRELRHPEDVWDQESINSMFMIPVTNNHPNERLVDASNFKKLSIGYTGESVKKDGDLVLSNFVINDKDGVDAVSNGKRELSLGYTVDLDENPGTYNGERYDARQVNIRYNHLALVNKARAGESARIHLDAEDAYEYFEDKEDKIVKRKIKIDAEEMYVEPQVGDYVDRLENDLKNLSDEKMRVERELSDKEEELKRVNDEIAMIRRKMESTEAERDAMKDRVSDMPVISYDSDEFRRAVSKRKELEKAAEGVLASEQLVKLDSMNDMDVKKAVIGKIRPKINLDGKGEVYIDVLFDTIVDESKSHVKTNSAKLGEVKMDSDMNDVEAARKEMLVKIQSRGAK